MQAIILCGGLSTRLGPITKSIPKILLQIGSRTVLDFQLDLLKEVGVNEVVLASGHLHNALYQAVGENYRGLRVRYAREKRKLGTGGAIKNAMSYVCTSPFFVFNGDILMKGLSLSRMLAHFSPDMHGLILGTFVQDTRSYGEIVTDDRGKISDFHEKQSILRSGYVNAAIYLLHPSIASFFPNRQDFSIERDVFPCVSNLHMFKQKEGMDWFDVGVPKTLAHARHHFS